MSAKIVVLDGHTLNPGDNPWDALKALGDVTIHDRSKPGEIVERCIDADIVVTNKAPLGADTLAQLPKLRFISVTATGYNLVDTAAARARGIPVSNVPVYGTDSVAQFTFALILELCHRVGDHHRSVQNGEWQRSPDWSYWICPHVELAGKTIGIVGMGRIGRRVGEIAHAFGMSLAAHSRSGPAGLPDGYPPVVWLAPEALFSEADVITLHCPQTRETEAMVNRRLLSRCKPGAFFINTARGGLVVEEDLARALNEGALAGAAVDVVKEEPIRPDNPLLGARNCLITPHNAWAGLEARRRLMAATAENVAGFLRGQPCNVVNS